MPIHQITQMTNNQARAASDLVCRAFEHDEICLAFSGSFAAFKVFTDLQAELLWPISLVYTSSDKFDGSFAMLNRASADTDADSALFKQRMNVFNEQYEARCGQQTLSRLQEVRESQIELTSQWMKWFDPVVETIAPDQGLDASRIAQLVILCVKNERQRQGLGSEMLEHLKQVSARARCH